MLKPDPNITESDDPMKRAMLGDNQEADLSPTAAKEYWGAGRITADDLSSLRELHAEFLPQGRELLSQIEKLTGQVGDDVQPDRDQLVANCREQRQELIDDYRRALAPITDRYTTAGVGYIPSPVFPTEPDFIEQAAAHYIEIPSPEIFERIIRTPAIDYFTVEESAVVEMIGSHVDLSAVTAEESPDLRRSLLLDAVRPMVEHAEGMPEYVRTNFMLVLSSYANDTWPANCDFIGETGELTRDPIDIYLDLRQQAAERLGSSGEAS